MSRKLENYTFQPMKERESEGEIETHHNLQKFRKKSAAIISLQKGVMGNKLGKLALQGMKNDTNPTKLWK